MTRAAALVLAFAATVHAYDSRCYLPGGAECAPGPQAARNRWIGVSDEHRQLWLRTLDLAGLSALVAAEAEDQFDLDVFTDNVPIDVAGSSMPTYDPLPFVDAQLVQRRTTSPPEFAQLPDFGFALWDWATGLETCPLDAASPGPIAPGSCHDFSTHMGAVNSNHFLPQAQAFFAYYHQLALGRADACKTMKQKLGSDASRFGDFLDACGKEAFVLEAIGHHFLQDAWSSGHMWERWGSPDLLDFTDLQHALLVAMTAGLIHGARGVLQDKAGFVGFDVNDALCAPGPVVAFALPPATPVPALGDLFLGSLLANDGAAFPDQYRQLFSCAASSVRQVADAMGESAGALDPSLVAVADPTGAVCFAQRDTNAAMSAGIGLDFKDTAGVQHRIELDSLQVASLVPLASAFIGTDPSNLSPDVVAAYLFDLLGMVAQARIVAAIDPTGTSLATGGLGTLVGVDRNAAFVQQPLAPYVDPPLPWPDPPTQANDAPTRALALARVFHRAHAIDWCNRFQDASPDGLDVNALRDHVTSVRQTDGRPSHVEAACAACTEFAMRHLRVGTDASNYDQAREPLCHFLADDPVGAQYVFQPGAPEDDVGALAAKYCGCLTVSVDPSMATVAVGATQQFAATVHGLADQHVTWTIVPGEGPAAGTIDATGLFTASAPGTATVRAASTVAPSAFADATVTVVASSCGTSFSKQLILGNHMQSMTFELDNQAGVIDESLPSDVVGFNSVSSGNVDFRSISLSADDPDTQNDVQPGGPVTAVAAIASVGDGIVLNTSNPALQGTDVMFDLSVKVTATLTVGGDHASARWSVSGGAPGLNAHGVVSTIAGQNDGNPSGGTFTASMPGRLGTQSGIGFSVSASAGLACDPGGLCPPTDFTGSAKVQVAVEVLGISNIRDLSGNPVSVSICSASGTGWGGG